MTCDFCNADEPRLTYDGRKFGCRACVRVAFVHHDGALHHVRKTLGGRLTEADARHVKTRMARKRRAPDPRWL